jgi:hypothetical protein
VRIPLLFLEGLSIVLIKLAVLSMAPIARDVHLGAIYCTARSWADCPVSHDLFVEVVSSVRFLGNELYVSRIIAQSEELSLCELVSWFFWSEAGLCFEASKSCLLIACFKLVLRHWT